MAYPDHPGLSAWLTTWALALTAALGISIAHRLTWAVVGRLAKARVMLRTLLRFAERPAGAVLILLALEFVWDAAPRDLPALGAVEHATLLVLTAAFGWLGVRCVAGVADAVYQLHPVDQADNLHARQVRTQTGVLATVASGLIVFVALALALMSFPAVRTLGTSLLASAGVAGLVVGMAARPVLGNLIAGLQLALTQPLRLDDVVVIEGEWGRIEQIRASYVVVNIWDGRRLIVPLQWFIEHPFVNWTLDSAALIGSVHLWVDYRLPLAPLRAELERICRDAPEWDHRVCSLAVTQAGERAMQVRALVSAADSGSTWDLRCRVREGLVSWIQQRFPQFLPRTRVDYAADADGPANPAPAAGTS
ncbi:MAG TPA: mechanosensitive ion channel domain-containing protein [Casimicrobiaceae bacterium]|nr:mechanosensitive ion channel domain-containing protein [Casimicrobiaceae bacterium]